ncbi:MAG: transposase [Thermodesulfobacteriota bacterium]|nr:transposase [Thermodesulfobacteriota bacterium]
MPRIARMIVKGEDMVYHVISRTALDGYVIGDVEKGYLLKIIKKLSSVYFAEVLGFCLMGNHFHLVVRMHTGEKYTDDEIRRRFQLYYGDGKRELTDGQIPSFREKWSNLSEYVKEIKQGFSRFYNKLHHRKGFFWSDRFKSIIVENGETLINCLAHIDLNPIRAGICERPEEYRWCSFGYHIQTNNNDTLLSLDFGLQEFGIKTNDERLRNYREYVYEKGSLSGIERERSKGFEINRVDRFRYRTRYFTDSGIIGTKVFVQRYYEQFKHHFSSKNEKVPKGIKGLEGVYSMKRLSEKL